MLFKLIKKYRGCYKFSLIVGYAYACVAGMTILSLVGPTFTHSDQPVVAQVETIQSVTYNEPLALPEPQIVEEDPDLPLTDAEIDLIALVTMAEAEGESEEGKRLVISTILNRIDHERFPDTVNGVVYQRNAFEVMHNGRINRCYVTESNRELVISELQNRTNYDVVYFRSGHYSSYGTPLFKVGNHYFSSN